MQTVVAIPGIHCEGCANLIKDVSGDFPAIKKIDIDLSTKHVTLEHDDQFSLPAWSKEVEALNPKYQVQSIA